MTDNESKLIAIMPKRVDINPARDFANAEVNAFYLTIDDMSLLLTRDELLRLVDIAVSVLYP